MRHMKIIVMYANTVQARKVKAIAERAPNDAIEVEFDTFGEFDICGASYTPIYAGEASVACPFDGTKYHTSYKGTVCKTCEVCAIGATGSGLRLTI